MRRLVDIFRDTPALWRWGVLGAVLIVLASLLGAGVWSWLGWREARAQRAFAVSLAAYRQAAADRGEVTTKAAVERLNQFLKDHPRSSSVAHAWYLIGNLEYQRRGFELAQVAFEQAARRGGGSLASLARFGAGYAREAKGELAGALETYRAALVGRDAGDFLYPDLLMAVARIEEAQRRPEAAVEAYRRLLKDVPAHARVEEVRIRLAELGASSP